MTEDGLVEVELPDGTASRVDPLRADWLKKRQTPTESAPKPKKKGAAEA